MKTEGYKKITKFTGLVVWQEGHKLVLSCEGSTFQGLNLFGISGKGTHKGWI